MADIERVAKEANAHNFVSELPEGYRTRVGSRASLACGTRAQEGRTSSKAVEAVGHWAHCDCALL
eukprot:6343919-Ditylum_brightwellii.AAC.1